MTSMTIIYGIAVVFAVLLVNKYWKTIKNKEKGLCFFYIAVLVFNIGCFGFSVLPDRVAHFVVMLFSLAMFSVICGIVLYELKKENMPRKIARLLWTMVLGTVAVWFIEQVLRIKFEFLTVFYTIFGGVLLILSSILDDILMEQTEAEEIAYEETKTMGEELFGEIVEGACAEKAPVMEKTKVLEDNRKEDVFAQVVQKMNVDHFEGLEKLSVRELEVLLLILDNKKRKSIAEEMEITENTVKKHTSHIFSKLGVSSRKELFEKCEKNN